MTKMRRSSDTKAAILAAARTRFAAEGYRSSSIRAVARDVGVDAALVGTRAVHFIHFARNRNAHAFREAIDARNTRHAQLKRFYVYDEHADEAGAPHATGRLSSAQLADWLPASRDVDAYFLGPKPFMRRIKQQLCELGIPKTQTHYEFFGPASALE